MTKQEAIEYLQPIAENSSLKSYKNALTLAIEALKTLDAERCKGVGIDAIDKPLTLDELKVIDGEPIWIVEWPDWGHWELSCDAEGYLGDREESFYGLKHDDPEGKYGLHKLGWLAYRQKPKRGGGADA